MTLFDYLHANPDIVNRSIGLTFVVIMMFILYKIDF